MSRGIKILIVVVVGLFVLFVAPLALIGQLLFGWAFFLARVVPVLHIEPGGVVLGMACLVGVAVLGHWVASWLWREAHTAIAAPCWRLRWTAISLGMVLLMFVCGVAATGVVHQTGWLLRAEESMFTRSSRPAVARIKCGSDIRQIGFSLAAYAETHEGRLPDSLAALRETRYVESLTCPSNTGLDYVYYGRGLSWPAGDGVPILAEPLVNHEGEGMNLLFGDGSVEFLKANEAETVLARRPR